MSDFPDPYQRAGIGGVLSAGGVTPFADFCDLTSQGYANTATVWAANRAVFQPVVLSEMAIVTQIAIRVQTQAGNYDVGIYDMNNNRLVSLGTTATPAAGVVIANIADTTLPSGWYKLALASDSATAVFRSSTLTAPNARSQGVEEMAAGFPLPNPATPVGATVANTPAIVGTYRTTF